MKFPVKVSSKEVVPKQILQKYPSNKIYDNKEKFNFEILDVIDAPMQKEHLKVYNLKKLILEKEDESSIWSAETQISNFIYQTLNQSKNDISVCYGEEGFKSITVRTSPNSYKFKNEKIGQNFLKENIHNYSSKIALILKFIEKSDGPVFIFSKYLWGGLIPMLIALEMNGYNHYKSNSKPFINNKYKKTKYKGDYVIKSGTLKTPNLKYYLKKRHDMIKENVKVFLGTETAAEGLNLFGYREVHILEPHFNFSLIKQVIGRTIRNESHISLPYMKRNVTIYLYASTDKDNETVDLFKYKISENKIKVTTDVLKVMKEMSIDCYLNYNYNSLFFIKKINVKGLNSNNEIINIDLNDNLFSKNYSSLECDGNKNIMIKSKVSKYYYNNDYTSINKIIDTINKYKNRIIKLVLKFYIISVIDLKEKLQVAK